jgi:hypothetical protein
MRHALQNTIAPPEQQSEPADPAAVADYIATFVSDLSILARGQSLDTLGYILDMAKLEAETISQSARRRS